MEMQMLSAEFRAHNVECGFNFDWEEQPNPAAVSKSESRGV
jgi:hypothetical protein